MNSGSNSKPLEVDCKQVKTKIEKEDDFLLLDCREKDEYEVVRIDGATLLPMSEIQERVEELEPHKDSEVVVYCHHGGRSMKVALWLRGQGFSEAQSMAGGIDQWALEIDPRLPRY